VKVLIVDTYYPDFLQSYYAKNPDLSDHSYQEEWRLLMDECFGTADYYSTNLAKLGHEATEVVANCQTLQIRWARESGVSLPFNFGWRSWGGTRVPWPCKDWLYPVLLAQVKHYKPDVIHVQDPNGTDPRFLRTIRPLVRLITAQIASPVSGDADFSGYDLMLSSFPHFVRRFREEGLRSEYFNLGFEPKVLERVKRSEQHQVVFVGGFSRSHIERINVLSEIASRKPFTWWGYGIEELPKDSPLRSTYRGTAWALDMYEKLYNALICLNHHIDVAESYANNMRLYEATGVGSLLVTDYRDNLHCLFEPGKEVVAYRNAEECAELVKYYLDHVDEREAIARAGQQRTLREHTYYHRMQEYVGIVRKQL